MAILGATIDDNAKKEAMAECYWACASVFLIKARHLSPYKPNWKGTVIKMLDVGVRWTIKRDKHPFMAFCIYLENQSSGAERLLILANSTV